jgi:hypothetical protein
MKKEANLLRELLKLNKNLDRFARLNICECLRQRLLNFLMYIHDCKLPEYDLSDKYFCLFVLLHLYRQL